MTDAGPLAHSGSPEILLSICIATYNRGAFIGQTLESIIPQLSPGVELLVVDGASPDQTASVMAEYVNRFPVIRYFREAENSGVDGDYDKAVGYARGKYCWLMTDDDLLEDGAISSVLADIADQPDLVVVNSVLKTVDLARVLNPTMLSPGPNLYASDENEKFFAEVGAYLSFIGCVVVRRDLWMSRDRRSYYGSLFIHVGVIFQAPIGAVKVIRHPLIAIRYGNAMWTPRGFEIWMFKWPGLIWSFDAYTEAQKAKVCRKEPWRQVKRMLMYRALGGYSRAEYQKFMAERLRGGKRWLYFIVSVLPAGILNGLASLYCVYVHGRAFSDLYDLSRSKHAGFVSRYLARRL